MGPIVLIWFASAAFRWYRYDDQKIPENVGASYHVLLTVEALDRTPARTHHLLPIVTLGRALDRDVRFGASVESPDGAYYYTSFPSLGFIAPWVFFKATGLAPSVRDLMVFNLLIHLAATLLVALLVGETTTWLGVDLSTGLVASMLSALTYLFTFEARYSHGVVYWHHSLFQVVWLAQLLAAARTLARITRGSDPTMGQAGALAASALIAPMTEWTGYLTTSVTAFVLWRAGRATHPSAPAVRRLAMIMLGLAFAAGILFLAQFASVIGLAPLGGALVARAAARSAVHIEPLAVARGYVDSLGVPLLVFLATVVALGWSIFRRQRPVWLSGLLIATSMPLVENVILAEHAATWHFDRLKGLVVCILLLATTIAAFPTAWRERALVVWSFVIATMLLEPSGRRLGGSSPPMASNERLLRAIHERARPCTVYGTDGVARGWVELTVGGNVYESIPSADSLRAIAAARGACQSIYLRSSVAIGETMYIWGSATVSDASSGHIDTIPGTPRRRPRVSTPVGPGM